MPKFTDGAVLKITYNGFWLAEGGALVVQNCQQALKPIRRTDVELPTSAPLLASQCYALIYFGLTI